MVRLSLTRAAHRRTPLGLLVLLALPAIGLALACSGEAPTSPDPASAAHPMAALGSPHAFVNCTNTANGDGTFLVTVFWSGYSADSVQLSNANNSITLALLKVRDPRRSALQFLNLAWAPTTAELLIKKSTLVAITNCTGP